jgi:hypothetical protein
VVSRPEPSTPPNQVGSALGLAAVTAVATSQGAAEVGNAAALTDGYTRYRY